MFIQNVILPFVYFCFRKNDTDKKLVVFADAHHESCPPSMELLLERVKKSDLDVLEFFYDFKKLSAFSVLKISVSFMKLYSRAGYVVICDNFLPVAACRKKPSTKVIQLWHGSGAFKKFGYDTTDDIPAFYKGSVYKNYDIVTVSSPECSKHFSSAMRLDEEVFKPVGISRTDIFFSEEYNKSCREEFFKNHPEAKGKRIVLWAPTYHGNAGSPYIIQWECIKSIEKDLGSEWFVIKKYHPHIGGGTVDEPCERLLPVADVLISDYSSVIFDFMFYRKPIVYLIPDFESYYEKRGFYIDYGDLPGEKVTDESKLAEAVRSAYNKGIDKNKYEAFISRYLSACDGKSTDRIFEFFNNDL